MVSISVYFGNSLYTCNNWAGGMSAVYSLPGMYNFILSIVLHKVTFLSS